MAYGWGATPSPRLVNRVILTLHWDILTVQITNPGKDHVGRAPLKWQSSIVRSLFIHPPIKSDPKNPQWLDFSTFSGGCPACPAIFGGGYQDLPSAVPQTPHFSPAPSSCSVWRQSLVARRGGSWRLPWHFLLHVASSRPTGSQMISHWFQELCPIWPQQKLTAQKMWERQMLHSVWVSLFDSREVNSKDRRKLSGLAPSYSRRVHRDERISGTLKDPYGSLKLKKQNNSYNSIRPNIWWFNSNVWWGTHQICAKPTQKPKDSYLQILDSTYASEDGNRAKGTNQYGFWGGIVRGEGVGHYNDPCYSNMCGFRAWRFLCFLGSLIFDVCLCVRVFVAVFYEYNCH